MSRGFTVPLGCFAIMTMLAFSWPLLSGASSLTGVERVEGALMRVKDTKRRLSPAWIGDKGRRTMQQSDWTVGGEPLLWYTLLRSCRHPNHRRVHFRRCRCRTCESSFRSVSEPWLRRFKIGPSRTSGSPRCIRRKCVTPTSECSRRRRFSLQKGPVRVLLDPIAYDVPGAEGVVDLYLMPTYDDMASLSFEHGDWVIRYARIPMQHNPARNSQQ